MEIETINIIINTNIPNGSETSLTKNMIYHPTLGNTSSYSEYPFFSKNVDYSKIVNYISVLSYKDLVETFFIKSAFEKIMKLGYVANLINQENMNRFVNTNVNIMLSLLFPTTYPVPSNYENTSSALIGTNGYNSQTSIFSNLQNTFSVFNPSKYSYIQISSNKYTIVKSVWLNDFFNHPKYFSLMEEYKKLLKWKVVQHKKLQNEIKKKEKAFMVHLKKKENQTKLLLVNAKEKDQHITATYRDERNPSAVESFKTAINTIIENVNKNKSFEELESTLSNMVNNYDTLFREFTNSNGRTYKKYEINDSSLKKQIEYVVKLDKEIKTYKILVNQHITENPYQPINMNYNDEKVKEIMEKYSQISTFKKSLELYNEPTRESTNYILQNEIDNFQKGYENVLQDIMNPTNLMVDKSAVESQDLISIGKISKYLNTGVCIVNASENKPINEIYVKLYVIKGELNDENKNILNCMYKSEYLTDELKKLLNNDTSDLLLNKSSFYFDITDKKIVEKIKNETAKNEAPLPAKPMPQKSAKSNKTTKGGSRRIKRKRFKKTCKTNKWRLFFV